MPLGQTKSGSPDLGAAWGAPNRTYPDQATRTVRGDGDGIGFIGAIIHDFISYNHKMRFDFGRLLQSRLSARDLELLRGAAAEAESRGLPIYVVGGLLRDLALGVPVTDLDLVVEGDAISLGQGTGSEVRRPGRFTRQVRHGEVDAESIGNAKRFGTHGDLARRGASRSH